jgi:predicted DNA-binding protein
MKTLIDRLREAAADELGRLGDPFLLKEAIARIQELEAQIASDKRVRETIVRDRKRACAQRNAAWAELERAKKP